MAIKFNYTAARDAGFTDEQIAQSLAAKRAQGIQVFVDRTEVEAYKTHSPNPPSGGASGRFDIQAGASPYEVLRTRAVENLPTIGGIAGGLLGGAVGGPAGPFTAVGGAAAGGELGYAAQRFLQGERPTVGGIAGAGAGQGALELGGLGLGALAGTAARPLMRRALGAGKAVQKSFPDVAETALRQGLAVSQGGVAKANALREASAKALNDLLTQARTRGTMLNTRSVTQPVRALLRSNVIPDEEKAQIAEKLVRFLSDKTARMDPLLLKEIKQFYQNRAAQAYRGLEAGGMPEALGPTQAFSKAIAQGARQQLETIPGVAGREATTRSLIGAQKALEAAVARRPRAITLHQPGTYLGPILGGQNTLSRVALMLNSPYFKTLLRQSPRAAAAALLTHTDQPDQTNWTQ
jgi:hypothetical protein